MPASLTVTNGAAVIDLTLTGPDLPAISHIWPALAIIRELRAKGWSRRQIAHHLNSKGLATFRGNPWSMSRVSQVVRSYIEGKPRKRKSRGGSPSGSQPS
jgi:hypothetical protein